MDLRRCLRDQSRRFTDRNLQAVPSKVVGNSHGLFRCRHERNRGQPALHDSLKSSEGGGWQLRRQAVFEQISRS